MATKPEASASAGEAPRDAPSATTEPGTDGSDGDEIAVRAGDGGQTAGTTGGGGAYSQTTAEQVRWWTVDEVADWLILELEMPQYVEKFEELNIDGTSLLDLTRDELEGDMMGVLPPDSTAILDGVTAFKMRGGKDEGEEKSSSEEASGTGERRMAPGDVPHVLRGVDKDVLMVSTAFFAGFDAADVCVWLDDLGLTRYLPTFRLFEVDGATMLRMSRKEFQTTLGVTDKGDLDALVAAMDIVRRNDDDGSDGEAGSAVGAAGGGNELETDDDSPLCVYPTDVDSDTCVLPVAPSSPYRAPKLTGIEVDADVEELFTFIGAYKPRSCALPVKLLPFIPDYTPAIGRIDEMVRPPRPDGKDDGLGCRHLALPGMLQPSTGWTTLRVLLAYWSEVHPQIRRRQKILGEDEHDKRVAAGSAGKSQSTGCDVMSLVDSALEDMESAPAEVRASAAYSDARRALARVRDGAARLNSVEQRHSVYKLKVLGSLPRPAIAEVLRHLSPGARPKCNPMVVATSDTPNPL